jgi:hypothetical protein
MDRRVVGTLCSLVERLRCLRVCGPGVGLRQVGFEYDRFERRAGVPKYNFRKLNRLAIDGVTSASYGVIRDGLFRPMPCHTVSDDYRVCPHRDAREHD